MSWKKKLLTGAAVLMAVVLLVCGIGVGIILHYISKINFDDGTVGGNASLGSIYDEEVNSGIPDSPSSEIDDLESAIEENTGGEVLDSKDVINVLLIGTDRRNPNERGRSDSMMLVSLNKVTKKIYVTSIMRDTYVDIPGVSNNNRINAAYSFGGASLLMDTVERNFRVKVDKYVSVDFESFKKLVDYFGGVEITVSDAEAGQINGLDKGGTYLLNGEQALAYARIRYVGQGDFERTERQRRVLNILIDKCRSLSVFELGEIMDLLLPQVTTNMSKSEIFGHVLASPSYASYQIINQRIPCDGSWRYMTIRGMSVLGIDFEENFEFLKSTVYAGT